VAASLRAFSSRLRFNYSVLVRDLQRLDRDAPIRWGHVERVLRAADLPEHDDRWREIHALWYTAGERRKTTGTPRRRPFVPTTNGEPHAAANHKPSVNGAQAAGRNGREHRR
jgi:hypothetical protein